MITVFVSGASLRSKPGLMLAVDSSIRSDREYLRKVFLRIIRRGEYACVSCSFNIEAKKSNFLNGKLYLYYKLYNCRMMLFNGSYLRWVYYECYCIPNQIYAYMVDLFYNQQ